MTAVIKFVESLPQDGRSQSTRGRVEDLYAALAERPGQWAEIERDDKRNRLAMRANYLTHRSSIADRIECTTRKVGDEFVLYARAVTR